MSNIAQQLTKVHLKCVCVGDGAVGKTSMLLSYANDHFPEEYIPTVFDNYSKELVSGGKLINLGLWDTAGQDDYDRLRPVSYPSTDVFMILFSVVSPKSFKNIVSKWYPEIKMHAPDTPFMLIGCMNDLRTEDQYIKLLKDRGESMVTQEEGEALATQLNAVCYMECSALTQVGLKEVFDRAISIVVKPDEIKEEASGCCNVL